MICVLATVWLRLAMSIAVACGLVVRLSHARTVVSGWSDCSVERYKSYTIEIDRMSNSNMERRSQPLSNLPTDLVLHYEQALTLILTWWDLLQQLLRGDDSSESVR